MKKLFIILLVLIASINSFSQDVVGDRVIAKQSLYLRSAWADSLKNDTINLNGNVRALMTANAIYSFVSSRIGNIPGTGTVTSVGSGYGLSGGAITVSGTLLVDSATLSNKYLRRTDSVGLTGYATQYDISQIQTGLLFPESVIESNDSIFLEGEKIYTPATNTFYGRDNANNPGYHSAAIINLTDVENKHFLNYKNGEWLNTKYFQEMRWTVGTDFGYPSSGDSAFSDTAFTYRKYNVFRGGLLQWEGTYSADSSFEVDEGANTITFHPPFSDGERVVIQLYDTLQWNSITHSIEESYVVFTTTGDLTESPTGTWTSAAGTGAGYSTTTLGAANDGYFVIQNNSATSTSNPIGLDDDGSNVEAYTAWEYCIYRNTGNYWRIDNGGAANNTGVASANGHWLRLLKTGTTVKAQYSATSGSSWVDIYTFSVNAGHTLYAKTDLVVAGTQIQEAKVYNFQ